MADSICWRSSCEPSHPGPSDGGTPLSLVRSKIRDRSGSKDLECKSLTLSRPRCKGCKVVTTLVVCQCQEKFCHRHASPLWHSCRLWGGCSAHQKLITKHKSVAATQSPVGRLPGTQTSRWLRDWIGVMPAPTPRELLDHGRDNLGALAMLTIRDAVQRPADVLGTIDGIAVTYRTLIRHFAWANAVFLNTNPVIERGPQSQSKFHCAACFVNFDTIQDVFQHSSGNEHLDRRDKATLAEYQRRGDYPGEWLRWVLGKGHLLESGLARATYLGPNHANN